MKPFRLITVSLMLLLIAPVAKATFMLNVKVGQTVGNQIIEFNKSIQADYNEEIVISSESLKNKIVLNLKKIDDVLVNGNKISPIQVDMKLLNEMQRIIGRPQTVTSFYKRSAEFEVHSSGISSDAADLNVSINFEEPN